MSPGRAGMHFALVAVRGRGYRRTLWEPNKEVPAMKPLIRSLLLAFVIIALVPFLGGLSVPFLSIDSDLA